MTQELSLLMVYHERSVRFCELEVDWRGIQDDVCILIIAKKLTDRKG